ncbi:MAG: ArsC/Spx/MgsR family protein [Lentimicrobium sp.]|jgi:arsenate reductase (glutaredoxin)|nr:ArsC/Spx/MgsR family protein [Lentimicrobium sp.]
MIIYHNPKCRKSRAGLEYVKAKDPATVVKEYIREGISADEIREIVKMLGIPVTELVRTQEDYFKENLKGKYFTDEEWFNILSENPKLIRRPIVVRDGKAALADPPEKADEVWK